MSEFSDRPFVAGSVFGLRAFRVDQLGRLTGVTHQDVWRPGENVAACYAAPQYAINSATMQITNGRRGGVFNPSNYFLTSAVPSPDKPVRDRQANKVSAHSIAGVTCTCGFYAYFDGGNDYLVQMGGATQQAYLGTWISYGTTDEAPRIGAIVEGWGVCTVGTRGFRAEKAKIVALIIPDSTKGRLEVAFTKAQRNYPDALVFDTEREAVRAIPLTDPIQATPEDDDFWTRSAS